MANLLNVIIFNSSTGKMYKADINTSLISHIFKFEKEPSKYCIGIALNFNHYYTSIFIQDEVYLTEDERDSRYQEIKDIING